MADDSWVRLATGRQLPVAQLKAGDVIAGYDIASKRAVTTTVQFVEALQKRTPQITLPNGLRVTPEHPVFASGRYVAAADLATRETFVLATSQCITSRRAAVEAEISTNVASVETVYNIGVDAPYAYFANDLLVHNKDRVYHAPLDDAWLFMWAGL